MDPENEQSFRNCAWSNFALHAAQRWSALKCFIAVAGFLAAGSIALVREGASEWLAAPAEALLVLLGILFWLFDRRKEHLLEIGRAALKALDGQTALPRSPDGAPNPLRIFDCDEFRRRNDVLATGAVEGKIFGSVYGLGILLGIYLAALPFVVGRPLFTETVPPVPSTPSPGLQPPRPRPGPSFAYPPSVTPPHRPNFGPITPFPRAATPEPRPAFTNPPTAAPVPGPDAAKSAH